MRPEDLINAYFDRNPSVIAIVKNLVVELAAKIAEDNPTQSLETNVAALEAALPALRLKVRQLVENELKTADTVKLNTEWGSYEFRRGHLSMIWSPPEVNQSPELDE